MSGRIPILILGLVIATASCNNPQNKQSDNNITTTTTMCNKITPEELAAIRIPLDLYVQAAIDGDSKTARPAFADGATISHAENDTLICLPIRTLFDYYDETGRQPASYEISDVSIANDVAMVRIESTFGNARFCDMFTLVKAGGEWKIISKIFSVK